MSTETGIALAFVAMLCWGIGDFLIQKSTRKFGNFETIFLITGFGALVLLPFVYRDIIGLFAEASRVTLWILLGTGALHLLAALLELESLRVGKIAVVEPIWSLEILAASFFAYLILGESLSFTEFLLVMSLMVGLMLVSFHGRLFSKRHFLERGVYFALAGALTMGTAAFFTGWSARLTDPLMTNFIVNIFLMLSSGSYLLCTGTLARPFRHIISETRTVLPMVIADNAAWIAYAVALTLIPIGIGTALSESYIIIAVILGLAIGKERLESHQKVGLILAIISALTLAAVTV
ncbi:MAG: DMT family transporter [bacterium]|nr:DMT family transporter [bacterium]